MTNPKAQGGSYEREIAAALSLWYSEGRRDDIFYRSHSSGGRATNRKRVGKELQGQYGDICATDPMGKSLIDKWTIECKHGYGEKLKVKVGKRKTKTFDRQWCLLDMLDSEQKVPVFINLWRLAKKEARDAGKESVPILIMQRARRASLIAMPEKEFNIWKGIDTCIDSSAVPTTILVKRKGLSGIIIMNLQSFFNWTENIPRDRFKNVKKT
jgi:hypothetical protein